MLLKQLMVSLLTFTLAAFPSTVSGQSGATAQLKPTTTPPSLPVLYRHFLAYQLHLERKADALKQEGKNGEDFRTHYQKVLGFSDQEFAKVHQSAVNLEQSLQAKDAEIQGVIKSAREALPKGPVPKGFPVPGPPAQLKTLFAEREALITSEITTLHKQLTPADTAKLETFLQKDFAPAVTVSSVLPAHTPRPSLLVPEAKR